ncbi:MAG: hypothetical protein P4L55_20815 [Syntrophobacteraceae bacterium]|nr:hypothetical protein [Syntrophobacteraceae bacterium]
MSLPGGRDRREGQSAPLVLLGTVHCDPDGFVRSLAFFERYQPDLLLVEISPLGLKFRKERSPRLHELLLERVRTASRKLGLDFHTAMAHAHIASILRQISLPFEYRAAAAYAEKTGAPLAAVDYSGFSRKWIKTWPQMLSARNIELLLGMENRAVRVCALYARAARRIYEEDAFFEAGRIDAPLWRRRETLMAGEIAAALKRFTPQRPVYIGGWWHLCRGADIKTIRDLLGIPETSCILLHRAV